MELFGLLVITFLAWVAFKILAALFSAGAFLITLPFKIIGMLLFVILIVPLSVAGFALFGILLPLIPVVLVVMAIIALLRHS